jgi:hypothetical protein
MVYDGNYCGIVFSVKHFMSFALFENLIEIGINISLWFIYLLTVLFCFIDSFLSSPRCNRCVYRSRNPMVHC